MRETPVDPDLAVQFSLLLRCCEFRLGDQFRSKNIPTFYVLHLVAPGKAALAEKPSLNVLSSDPLAIAIQETLLDKRIRKAL